jgi:hypothetical protein
MAEGREFEVGRRIVKVMEFAERKVWNLPDY